ALRFFGRNIYKKGIFICDRCRLNLENIEQTSPHQRAEPFIQSFRAVSFSSERAETLLDETRTQPGQAIHKNFATEVIKLTGRNRDVYRDATVYCGLRL